MPTRNINLTPKQDALIDEMLREGEYANATEALMERRSEEALKLEDCAFR